MVNTPFPESAKLFSLGLCPPAHLELTMQNGPELHCIQNNIDNTAGAGTAKSNEADAERGVRMYVAPGSPPTGAEAAPRKVADKVTVAREVHAGT